MALSPAFRRASPLLVVTLVNKLASLGLALLPALLVAREVGTSAATATMALSGASSVVGSALGGVICDRAGSKRTLVLSFLLAALGVGAMIPDGPWVVLVAGASVAQLGTAMFPSASRLLLAELVPLEDQREALAWLRSTTNLSMAASFGLGAAFGSRLGGLLALDVGSSLLAAALASRFLPEPPARAAGASTTEAAAGSTFGPFVRMVGLMTFWNLTYNAYLTAVAAQLRSVHGPEGASWYSSMMLLNVIGCGLLGVVFSARIASPRGSVAAGAVLVGVGSALGVARPDWLPAVFLGMALVTLGELLFTATAQFVWMALVPPGPRRGTWFSASMSVVWVGRAIGGALAFPVVVDGPSPAVAMALLGLPLVVAAVTARGVWSAFERVGGVR